MRRIVRLLLLVILVFGCHGIASAQSGDSVVASPSIRLATAPEGGTYFAVGSIAERKSVNGPVRIRAVPTLGSWESLVYLSTGRAEFALAQLDAVAKYFAYISDSSLWCVTPLYQEFLHILVRAPLGLDEMSEFAGKTIYMGPRLSGTEITAKALLELLGISSSEYRRVDAADLGEVISLVRSDSLDIVMFVGPLGSPFVEAVIDSSLCRPYSLSIPAKKRLTLDVHEEQDLNFQITEIPSGTYERQSQALTTVAVWATLVALRDLPEYMIDSVASTVEGAIRQLHAIDSGIDLSAPKNVRLPQGLYVYDADRWPGIRSQKLLFAFNLLGLAAILGAVFWLLRKYRPRIFRLSRTRTLALIASSAAVLCMICGIGIYVVEHTVNIHFESLYETAWSMLVYITSGLEDRAPITPVGRVLGSVLLLAGPVFLAILTGFLASSLVVKALEKNMARNLKGHYVILNWNPRTFEVIKQMHSPDIQQATGSVIVVVSDDPQLDLDQLHRRFNERDSKKTFEDVYFYPGNPCDEASLLNANAQDAKAVIIMADDKMTEGADEKSIRSLFALQRIAREYGGPSHLVIELLNIQNSVIVDSLTDSFPGTVDAVVGGQMRTLLIAQASLVPGLTDFYKDLLNFSPDTNELYLVPIPPDAEGISFPEYASRVILGAGDSPLIPVGLARYVNGKPQLIANPKRLDCDGKDNPYYRICRGDKLLVMSYETPGDSRLYKLCPPMDARIDRETNLTA